MVEGDDLLNIGFYKIRGGWFKWDQSSGEAEIWIYFYDDKSIDVDLVVDNRGDRSGVSLHNIKTLTQIQNLIKALEGEE